MTEEEAREKGISYKIGMFPLMVNGKAMVEGVRDGFVKIIAGKEYEEVLGVHIMAPHASEMIHQACTALTLEATLDELIETIYPHPTMGEAILEAALSAKGKAIHI
jgi:dihydrolipoamide dehydrogenase